MKKNKIIIGSSVAALAIIGMGAFAFFSDHAEDDVAGTVGTVDVSVSEGGALDLSNKENINPGDEKNPYDPENPGSAIRQGVDEARYPTPRTYSLGLGFSF